MSTFSLIFDLIASIGIIYSIWISINLAKRTTSNVAYDRWDDVYTSIGNYPSSIKFLIEEGVEDVGELLTFMRIIDLYADRDDSGLAPEGSLLETVLRSDKGKMYWNTYGHRLYSDKDWIDRLSKIASK